MAESERLRVALVTTPASSASPVGAHARRLLPHLREHCDVTVHVEGPEPGPGEGLAARLDPQAVDRILYPLANEREHAFMLTMVRELGGSVVLHDWDLAQAAHGAWPRLEEGGLAGALVALREGGLAQARVYRRGVSDPAVPLVMNRSVVRFADAFLVHSPELKQRVIRDRNAVTPVGVLESDPDDLPALAAEVASALEVMPPHRAKKRASIPVQVWRELRARRAEAGGAADG